MSCQDEKRMIKVSVLARNDEYELDCSCALLLSESSARFDTCTALHQQPDTLFRHLTQHMFKVERATPYSANSMKKIHVLPTTNSGTWGVFSSSFAVIVEHLRLVAPFRNDLLSHVLVQQT